MTKHRIYSTSVASVYPHYVAKAEKNGRAKSEVDEILRWLTGYSQKALDAHLAKRTDFETFFAEAPRPDLEGRPAKRGTTSRPTTFEPRSGTSPPSPGPI